MLGGGSSCAALFAGNDTIAVGAVAALCKVGLLVPGDIAAVGYDDTPLVAYAAAQ